MRALTPQDLKVVRGVTLRRDPAREACFTVADLHHELHDYDDMSEISRRQRLHRHMHNEMQIMEITSQAIVDFPDAPWELRMNLARQCWDEGRHSAIMYRRLKELGGEKGEFPVMNYEWGITMTLDSLPARLAVQNRSFEGGEIDLLKQHSKMWIEAGDRTTAEILDVLLADELHHVRYANRWLKRFGREDPRALLLVLAGIAHLKKVTKGMAPEPGEVNAVGVDVTNFVHAEMSTNIDDRRLADFTEAEIADLIRQEGFGPVVGTSRGTP